MSITIVAGIALTWGVVSVAAALVVGRIIRRADTATPTAPQAEPAHEDDLMALADAVGATRPRGSDVATQPRPRLVAVPMQRRP
ncbi:MAG: hypothetical protein PGN11_16220 [Quadrisphaera sp.]